jgi:predicted hydrocarbon binding protein
MRLEELRAQLNTSSERGDPELLREMLTTLQAAAGGRLVESVHEDYTSYYDKRPIRPTLPNDIQFLYMRDRQTFMFVLFPELLPVAYQIGRTIGALVDAWHRDENPDLGELLGEALELAPIHGYARSEIVTAEQNFAVYRHYESADSYGLPNVGFPVCAYEAGVAAGALEAGLGRPVDVREVKCCAAGDPYCEFEVSVGSKGNKDAEQSTTL